MKADRIHKLPLTMALLSALLSMGIQTPVPVRASEDSQPIQAAYEEYEGRLQAVRSRADIEENGFQIVENQVFPLVTQRFGQVSLIPALDQEFHRLVLFLAEEDGSIVYRTEQLEANNRNRGRLKQPNRGIAAISFQDLNGDGLADIILITSCVNESGGYAGKPYKIGDVLFQGEDGFYRDYRLSDKINRFGMNKSIRFITSFVEDGYSTEFLYTATTLEELLEQGFSVSIEQCSWRPFEKQGRLLVVPGTYRMAEYTVFMVYLVNEQGYIVWSFQPMGDYENLYAIMGLNCRDIDGDGLRDIIVLGRYSYENEAGEPVFEADYSIYYQRTSGFDTDVDFKGRYRCGDSDTVEELVEKARSYWGWNSEK